MGGGVRVTCWDVTRATGYAEDVESEFVHVLGGALVFFDDDPSKPTVLYAPGAWTVAVRMDDDES